MLLTCYLVIIYTQSGFASDKIFTYRQNDKSDCCKHNYVSKYSACALTGQKCNKYQPPMCWHIYPD